MRKVSWACNDAAMHHALAACAITEAGVTKKKLLEDGFRRHVKLEDEGISRGEGEYYVELDDDGDLLRVKTYEAECIMRWRFTYPGIKLVTYHLERCSHLSPWRDL